MDTIRGVISMQVTEENMLHMYNRKHTLVDEKVYIFPAIGVKLCHQWWQLDEALKSSAPRHDGFHQVKAFCLFVCVGGCLFYCNVNNRSKY